MVLWAVAGIATLGLAIGFSGTGANHTERQSSYVGRSVLWRGITIPVPECFVADPREQDLYFRSTGWCGGVSLERGTAWLTVLYRPNPGEIQPFETWNPCAEFDDCRTTRKESGNVELECYSAVSRMQHGDLRRYGCRSLERRLAIRYICLNFFCDELEAASLSAWASLSSNEADGRTEALRGK